MSHLKNIILYSTPQGNVKVVFNNQTFWLSQKAMAQLLAVEVPAISKHLKKIFKTNELNVNSVVSKMETIATDGKKYQTTFYHRGTPHLFFRFELCHFHYRATIFSKQ